MGYDLKYRFESSKLTCIVNLRTFSKFSNIDFILKILPFKDDVLALSDMQKNWGPPTSFSKFKLKYQSLKSIKIF